MHPIRIATVTCVHFINEQSLTCGLAYVVSLTLPVVHCVGAFVLTHLRYHMIALTITGSLFENFDFFKDSAGFVLVFHANRVTPSVHCRALFNCAMGLTDGS
jgi:hypothetical protein